MERFRQLVLSAITLAMCVSFAVLDVSAAGFRTQNFIVSAETAQLAAQVGQAAEEYRRDLAMYWFGEEIRPWPRPCPITVIAGPSIAAQGETTYNTAPVRDFQMRVIGTPERILDSVLPHEITHTVLATHFGRPLPRWADEGICTTVEHPSEKAKHENLLREFLSSRRGIAMNRLFLLTEYPSDVLPMYAQGYSVCRFLIEQKDPPTFIAFLKDYIANPSWTQNVRKHYGYESLADLQQNWVAWVSSGSGSVEPFLSEASQIQLASANEPIAPRSNASPIPKLAPIANPTARQLAGLTQSSPSATNDAPIPENEGWYARQRENVAATTDPSNSNLAIEAIAPPSVRSSTRYNSAQPKREFYR